jgi:hypothetical protein
VTEPQVGHELRFMNGENDLDRLHFDDDRDGNQQVDPIAELKYESVVLDG